MTLGEKIARLRVLEGTARGLGREMTQTEVSNAIRDELGGRISQSYLSQIENGARLHLTSGTRQVLARFFKIHPGHLVDDLEDHQLTIRPRHDVDEKLDLWLIDGAEEFRGDAELSRALLAIAKHERSRDCLLLLAAIVENKVLIDRLIERLAPAPQPRRRRRRNLVER
jgi:transcriptional regulator with XRE-family HTH domain